MRCIHHYNSLREQAGREDDSTVGLRVTPAVGWKEGNQFHKLVPYTPRRTDLCYRKKNEIIKDVCVMLHHQKGPEVREALMHNQPAL